MTDLASPRVIDDTPPEMLEVLIAAECFRAKRCVRKYGGEECPTPWDLAHRRLGELLADWERVR